MSVFVDTSALFAVLDRRDAHHDEAARTWRRLLERGDLLRTHNYVMVETYALVQARLGMRAVRAVENAIEPLLGVQFVDERLHREAVTALRAANRRGVSLVDWTSFLFMRRTAMTRAFAFDADFAREGFGPPVDMG